jgi:hypothetical protein
MKDTSSNSGGWMGEPTPFPSQVITIYVSDAQRAGLEKLATLLFGGTRYDTAEHAAMCAAAVAVAQPEIFVALARSVTKKRVKAFDDLRDAAQFPRHRN